MAIDHERIIGHEAAQLIAVARQGPLDAPVPGCPGWDVARLAGHVGRVHRWATASILGGAEPDGTTLERPPKGDAVVDWAEAAIAPLLGALKAAPAPGAWNFVGADDADGSFWPRRMAVETSIHRWDTEDAVGGASETSPLDAMLAAEGIEEEFTLMSPRLLAGRTRKATSLCAARRPRCSLCSTGACVPARAAPTWSVTPRCSTAGSRWASERCTRAAARRSWRPSWPTSASPS
jgi:uncharacterized protein (TIGR03083 family)